MRKTMPAVRMLIPALLCLLVCLGGIAAAERDDGHRRLEWKGIERYDRDVAIEELPAGTISVTLPCVTNWEDGWYLEYENCSTDTIQVPDGRPIYALLVSGFWQNRDLNMFHFYNFARCLQEYGAYVHYAWWNNLLAPYMERPLHYSYSIPGTVNPTPHHDLNGFTYGGWRPDPPYRDYPNKAIPADDHQFQKDALKLLTRIHEENPDAVFILVGHSMGGAAVAKLAATVSAQQPDIEIALLAPIDPVGNRTCLPVGSGFSCRGYTTFTRGYAVRKDDRFWFPDYLTLGPNITYLYYRWQIEWFPPFDWPLPDWYQFVPDRPQSTSIAGDGTNVQGAIAHEGDSGLDASADNAGGTFDGHGEIVGFRGVKHLTELSWALALDAPHNWPSLAKERSYAEPEDRERVKNLRVSLMESWETDPEEFDFWWAPLKPTVGRYCEEEDKKDYCTYCMVSGDLCTILKTKLDLQINVKPVADAGEDQTVSADDDCIGWATLDGTGSTDPDGDGLTYTWTWNDGADEATGPEPTIELPLGVHEITLVVSDGEFDSDPDTVVITVADMTPPVIELEGSADMVLECGVDTWEDPGAFATDNCDPDVAVSVGGDTVDPAVPGTYTITYDAVDASGNAASQVIRTVTVQDTTPPTIESVTADPATLWPPNHSVVPIRLTVTAYDYCDATPEIILTAVTSDEPDDAQGEGDGHTTDDIQNAGIGTEDYQILLRAERQGGGDGRVYTITYSATDDSGNSASSSTVVTVGHDQSDEPEPSPPRRRVLRDR